MGRTTVILLFVLSLLPSAFLAWQGRDLPHLGSFHDDAIYLETARNLAVDNSYKIGSLPWTPAQTKYPPVYPLYLSIAWRITPSLDQVLPIAMFLNWLWLPVWIAGIYSLLRSTALDERMSVAIPALIAIHPEVQLASTRLMSDLMCAAIITWSLALRNPIFPALAYLVRTAALPLLAGMVIDDLWSRRWRKAVTQLALGLVPIGCWALWVASHRYPATTALERYYTDYLAYQLELIPLHKIPEHMYLQLDALVNSIARMLLLNSGPSAGWIIVNRIAAAAAIAGIVRLVKRGQYRAFALYALLASLMMLIWYFPPDTRALLPLLPLILLGFATEMKSFLDVLQAAWKKGSTDRVVAFGCGMLCLAVQLAMLFHGANALQLTGSRLLESERNLSLNTDQAYRWIAANVSPAAIFYTVDDPVFSLHTGRKALRTPRLEDAYVRNREGQITLSTQALAEMKRFNVDCILVSAKHFEEDPTDGQKRLNFTTNQTGLRNLYQTATELVACK